MELTRYRCDGCKIELDRPAYTLTDHSSTRRGLLGDESHFCSRTCIVRRLTGQAPHNQRMRLPDLLIEWERFGEALRREDREVFLEMLSEAEPLAQALLSSGEGVPPSEALFMAALLTIRSPKPSPPEAGLDRLL